MDPLDHNLDFEEGQLLEPSLKQPPKYWLEHTLRNYANPRGRASRFEYWNFQMWVLLFLYTGVILDMLLGMTWGESGAGPGYYLVALSMLIPGIMVAIRRMQDQGRSGYMLFINLVPVVGPIWFLVLTLLNGDQRSNSHGAPPDQLALRDGFRPGYTDNVILWGVIWLGANTIVWTLLQLVGDIDIYRSPAFELSQLLASYGGGLLVMGLACVIPDRTKRTALIIVAGVVMAWRIAETVMWVYESL